jgi:hypothetical protein
MVHGRVAGMFGLGRREDGLSEEMRLHLELLADEHRRRGLSDEDAKAAARRSFGAVLPVREAYRAQLRFPSVDALVQDVRFAARRLLRDRNATLAAIALLTLGVASTLIMGDILDRLLVRRLRASVRRTASCVSTISRRAAAPLP